MNERSFENLPDTVPQEWLASEANEVASQNFIEHAAELAFTYGEACYSNGNNIQGHMLPVIGVSDFLARLKETAKQLEDEGHYVAYTHERAEQDQEYLARDDTPIFYTLKLPATCTRYPIGENSSASATAYVDIRTGQVRDAFGETHNLLLYTQANSKYPDSGIMLFRDGKLEKYETTILAGGTITVREYKTVDSACYEMLAKDMKRLSFLLKNGLVKDGQGADWKEMDKNLPPVPDLNRLLAYELKRNNDYKAEYYESCRARGRTDESIDKEWAQFEDEIIEKAQKKYQNALREEREWFEKNLAGKQYDHAELEEILSI